MTTTIAEVVESSGEDITVLQFIVRQLTELKVAMQTTDLFNVFGVHITAYGVVISLFVVSMIIWFMSGFGDDDD